jgi:uncharacterized repeat protein (TIGR03806 family)
MDPGLRSNPWVSWSILSVLLGSLAACGAEQPAAALAPAPSSNIGAAGSLGAGGAAGVAGAVNAGASNAGADNAGAATGGSSTGPLIELPQELPSAYPAPTAPRTCLAMVTLTEPRQPAVAAADAGIAPSDALPVTAVSFDAGVGELEQRPTAPQLLSQTGCFADTVQHQVSAEFVPYVIRSPLWTDGAHKERFFSVPTGTTITVQADGSWLWPVGSVLIKSFAFDFPTTNGTERRPVETRLMKKLGEGRWHYWSYRWNEQGSDATLLDGSDEAYFGVAGETESLHYLFPSERSCRSCHGYQTEGVLGPTALQLDLEVSIQGTVRRQLDMLSELGVVAAQQVPNVGLVNPANETAPLEARARSYLHGNCAHCHHPGGYAPPDVTMDLRITTPLRDADLCGAYADSPSGTAHFRIAPGNLDDSDLWQRFTTDSLWRMPIVGTGLHDPLGEKVIKDWIESLESCPQ